jgi:nucleotide-binding universal stress UspA family protein
VKRVLIATDGSDHALKAAELAGELAAKLGAELHVLAVFCHDRSGEQELREFGRIEHLEDGLASILRARPCVVIISP